MIVCDLNTPERTKKQGPLERVEIWNIEASNPFSRELASPICNYGYRTLKEPSSFLHVIIDEMFGDHPMDVRVRNHDTRQSSWALLSKVLSNETNLDRLNRDWAKKPKGTSDETVSLTMELWPHGDSDKRKTMSTMEIRKTNGGYEYSIVENLRAPYALSVGQPIKGLVESANGGESPWNICTAVLHQLKGYRLLAESSPSPATPVSKPDYGQESLVTANL